MKRVDLKLKCERSNWNASNWHALKSTRQTGMPPCKYTCVFRLYYSIRRIHKPVSTHTRNVTFVATINTSSIRQHCHHFLSQLLIDDTGEKSTSQEPKQCSTIGIILARSFFITNPALYYTQAHDIGHARFAFLAR